MKLREYTGKDLKILQDNSKSAKECAKLLNRTENAIYIKRQRLGVSCGESIIDRLVNNMLNLQILTDKNLTLKDKAEALKISKGHAWRLSKALSLTYDQDSASILKTLKLTDTQCADKLGVMRQIVKIARVYLAARKKA